MADLVSFYDDLVAFQARCAFLCDAFSALAAQQQWEPNSQRGLGLQSAELKAELEDIRQALYQMLGNTDQQG